jgi:hypothetical protein
VNVVDFLLNKGTKAGETDARAFSLTKVLSSGAIVVGPLATLLVDKISNIDFSPGQIVALAIGLLGFLAFTASADVLGRSYAAATKLSSDSAATELRAAQAAHGQLVPFPSPVQGRMIAPGADPPVKILASAFGDQAYFLVRSEAGDLSWVPAPQVTFGDGDA